MIWQSDSKTPDPIPTGLNPIHPSFLDTTEKSHPLILNIDADVANRARKTNLLSTGGIDVIEADTVTAAHALIEAPQRPHVVLLEISPADTNGRNAAHHLKARWPGTVVIRMSPPEMPDADPAGDSDDGADCHLTTSIKAFELIAVTRAMLRLHQAERRSAAAHQRFHAIFEHAIGHAILICGPDGRISGCSTAAHAILGYAPEDIIGQTCERILATSTLSTAAPQATAPTSSAECWYPRRDGTRFWGTHRVVPLHDPDGNIAETLCILADRSAENDARDALQALTSQLEHLVAERTREWAETNTKLRIEMQERERASEQNHQFQKMQALGQLTGGIAHDFNNLLTAIMGGLEVTRRRIEDPRSLKLIDGSISAAQRGARLIAQLMAFARKQTLQVEYLQLNALVAAMNDLLDRGVGPGVLLAYNLAPDVWPVRTDANQLRTALLNLAINARDAMPDGGVLRIATGNIWIREDEAQGDLAPGAYATLMVRDNGIGMSDTVKARMFEPFFTTKDVGKGTGLGLAQVYGFVRQSGGDVRVDSIAGEGTTVTILLPRATDSAEQGRAAHDPPPGT